MFELTDKVALITGSTTGIGKGIALAFAKMGAKVIINSLSNDEAAKAALEEVGKYSEDAIMMKADVTRKDEVKEMFRQIKDKFGRLDILVNNAGISQAKDIFDMEIEDWDKVMNTNVTSVFLCAKYAMEIMKKQNSGRIISIASQAGERGALFGHVHYAASKGGVLAFSKTLARTAAPYGITVNCIAPGVIYTDFTHKVHTDEEIEALEASIPLGLGKPSDVSAAAVYLAADEARYVTGITLDVNGGSYIH